MSNILKYDNISSGDDVLASPVSNNFTRIAAAVNSSALNSDNYGQSSILSQHISTGAILSQHLGNNAVLSQHISASAVRQDEMNYASSDSGARVVQIGEVASKLPSGGVMFARMLEVISQSDTNTVPFTHVFSKAQDGNPNFTNTPIMAGTPIMQYANSTDIGPVAVIISAINSASAVMIYSWSVTQDNTGFLVHFGVIGPI